MTRNLLLLATDYIDDITKIMFEKKLIDYCFCIAPIKIATDNSSFIYAHPEKVTVCFLEDVEKFEAYDAIYDDNEAPALSKELLQEMLLYESVAIGMGRRREQYPSIDYGEEKRFYLKALRYWNFIIEKFKINYIYLDNIPHYRFSYIIYALAKIKKIKILLTSGSSIPEVMVYGTSIENCGNYIEYEYNNLLADEKIKLCGTIEDYYKKYSAPVTVKNYLDVSKRTNKKITKNSVSNYIFGDYIGVNGLTCYFRRYWTLYRFSKLMDNSKQWFSDRKSYLKWVKKTNRRILEYKFCDAMSITKYNKIAEYPNYNDRYIYFGLQLTPEATIIPRAGVFSEQLNSIQLIARIAQKYGIAVYVKEHYVQIYREREVYEAIKKIPNVKLIKTDVSSMDLISQCFAVSTQTGTCILEGALQGKPSIVTSSGNFWKGLPSLFEIRNETQGDEVMKFLLYNYQEQEKKEKIYKYFYAIQKTSLFYYNPRSEMKLNQEKYNRCLFDQIFLLTKLLKNELVPY